MDPDTYYDTLSDRDKKNLDEYIEARLIEDYPFLVWDYILTYREEQGIDIY